MPWPGLPPNWLLLRFWNGLLIGYLLDGFKHQVTGIPSPLKGFHTDGTGKVKHIRPCGLADAWTPSPDPDHAGWYENVVNKSLTSKS